MRPGDRENDVPLPRKKATHVRLAVGMALVAFFVLIFLLPHYIDGSIKQRITQAVAETYPAYTVDIGRLHYAVWENRLECDSVRILAANSAMTCTVAKFSLTGAARLPLLFRGALAPDQIASSHMEAQNFVMSFAHARYELRCARLRLSVPDSILTIELAELRPPMDDEQFFAGSKFRSTRFHLEFPECRVTGLASLGLLEGTGYRARTVHVTEPSLSVLINKDKPPDDGAAPPRMPKEIISSIKQSLHIDSIRIGNGRLMYAERYVAVADPAVLTCDSMEIVAAGIGNMSERGDTAVILAQGRFMHEGAMNVQMVMPLSGAGLSFRYSGSLSAMHLSAINPFIEISDHKRMKTGVLHEGSFDVDVHDGKANGSVRLAYKDMKIVAIDGKTGSESGVGNTLISLFANNIKLRTSNARDKSGDMKLGNIDYARKSDEALLEFAWLAVRGGICDVAGF